MKTRNTVTKLTIIPTDGPSAFASIQPEIGALTDGELVGISIDIPYAHSIALAAADRIDELMPELETLPGLDLGLIRKIRVYATACRHAHLLATSPETADPRLAILLEEASKLREDMLSQAETLAQFGLVSEARVAAIRAGSGNVDKANDLEQLGVLFGEVLPKVKGKVLVTEPMVKRALELAQDVHIGLGVKTIGGAQGIDDSQRVRQRAYTLFVRAYEECTRGVGYLRGKIGDADAIVPSIYVKQRKRGATTQAEPEQPEPPAVVETRPEDETPVPAPATTEVTATT